MSNRRKLLKLIRQMRTMRREPLPDCNGKKRYPDKKTAVTALNFMMNGMAQNRHRPEYLRFYYCEECNGYHLTKSQERG